MMDSPKPGIYVAENGLPAAEKKRRRALFLDRDGVINVNHGYVHTIERTQWVAGIFEFCAAAQDAGYLLVVITNQAGIARGYYSVPEFLAYTKWMHEEFARHGIHLVATLFCPHHPTHGLGELGIECNCRKPAPGMLLVASEVLNLSLGESVMVGDKESDVIAAARAGVPKRFLIDAATASPFADVSEFLSRNIQ